MIDSEPKLAHDQARAQVQARYGQIARGASGCCGDSCCSNTYAAGETDGVPSGADLGLGSGHPLRFAELRSGEVVLDLGSGAGVDAFMAARQVGPKGRVVGVDMTPDMLARARRLAQEGRFDQVEFREGLIEKLPFASGEADAVVSNCVINLSPDKEAVFAEAFRVLHTGGRIIVSDVVKELPFQPLENACNCVDGAMLRDRYLEKIRAAGFEEIKVLEDGPWLTVGGERLASAITVRARKP